MEAVSVNWGAISLVSLIFGGCSGLKYRGDNRDPGRVVWSSHAQHSLQGPSEDCCCDSGAFGPSDTTSVFLKLVVRTGSDTP